MLSFPTSFGKNIRFPRAFTKGRNTKKFIIVHHTGTNSFTGNLSFLSGETVSCHYVVGRKGELGKIGKHTDILWHAGRSSWKGISDLNKHSIGIEVCSDGKSFTQKQKKAVRELIEYIIDNENNKGNTIPIENILRHKDIAPRRKWDIADSFWNNEYSSWKDYQNSFRECDEKTKEIRKDIDDMRRFFKRMERFSKQGVAKCDNLMKKL